MGYIGEKCPVCEKVFKAGDDIVVCPECGTPHHRECYEELGHCFNEELHADGFDYSEDKDDEANSADKQVCPHCKTENEPGVRFCKYCGSPLLIEDKAQDNNNTQQSAGQNGGSAFPYAVMDPMSGVKGDADFGDGVTAAECAKYVKQNTPYFMRVFDNLKNTGRSRFNFAAALFSGGYLLYRKMYKLGAILTAVQALLLIFTVYFELVMNPTEAVQSTSQAANNGFFESLFSFYDSMSAGDVLMYYLYYFATTAMLGMRIALGIIFNRIYFRHCKREIVRIKQEVKPSENPETVLQTKGGVNMPLAISLLFANLIIVYLPTILQSFN